MVLMFNRYVLDMENWVEMCMIALICTILFIPDTGTDTTGDTTKNITDMKRHLAAVRHEPLLLHYKTDHNGNSFLLFKIVIFVGECLIMVHHN
jgi:hypothetical protein